MLTMTCYRKLSFLAVGWASGRQAVWKIPSLMISKSFLEDRFLMMTMTIKWWLHVSVDQMPLNSFLEGEPGGLRDEVSLQGPGANMWKLIVTEIHLFALFLLKTNVKLIIIVHISCIQQCMSLMMSQCMSILKYLIVNLL